MVITSTLSMDLKNRGLTPLIHAVQNESNTRKIKLSLVSGGEPVSVPQETAVLIRFRKADGTGGVYDTLPDGNSAYSIIENTVTVVLAPQVLTCAGIATIQVAMIDGDDTLCSFGIHVKVEPDPSSGAVASNDYINLSNLVREQVQAYFKDNPALKGDSGYTPVKGVDYWTPEDQEAIEEDAHAHIIDELAKRGQLKPEFANDTTECTDTSKVYVLPDGYIYGYIKKATAIEHNANDGTCGLNKRTTRDAAMSAADSAQNGNLMTPPIAVDNSWSECILTISGIDTLYPIYYAPLYIYYYTADGAYVMQMSAKYLGLTDNNEANLTIPADGLSVDLAIPSYNGTTIWANTAYIRIVLGLTSGTALTSTSDVVKNLVINLQPLNQVVNEYGWHSTGHMFNTDDYGQAIEKNAADIAELGERVTNAEQKIEQGAPSTGDGTAVTPLFNKLGLIGDSLTNQEYQKWQETVVTMLNISAWHKNAITGSTVARYSDTTLTPFVERYLDTPEDCDCIVIMGGTNDSSKNGQSMGEVGVLNSDTFKGAYSTIIEGLLERKPSTRIMLLTPPRSYSTSLVLHTRIEQYAEATKEVAKYYGLPCLDLYNTLGWNAKTAEWCSWDFAANDTVHFSKDVGPRVGRMVANFIRNNY